MDRNEAEGWGYGPEEIHGDREPVPITYGELSEDVRLDIASNLARMAGRARGLAAGIDYSGDHTAAHVLKVMEDLTREFRVICDSLSDEIHEATSDRDAPHPSLTVGERNPSLGGLDRSRSL